MAPAQAMIGGVRGIIEWVFSRAPVESACVHHDASDSCAVAAEPLCERMHDNVSTVFDGPGEVGSRKRGVHDQGNPAGPGML